MNDLSQFDCIRPAAGVIWMQGSDAIDLFHKGEDWPISQLNEIAV
jgi:hypothetical protein